MRRLHLRLYLTIVGTLVAFAFCAAILWHLVAWPQGAAWSIETATHLSANMLERAVARLSATPARTVAIQSDVRDVEMAPGSMDIIVAAAVLHHLREEHEWTALFKKLFGALRPSGSLWIWDFVEHDIPGLQDEMWTRYGDYLAGLKGEDYRRQVFEYVEYEDTPRPLLFQIDLLREVGFREVEILHKNSCFAAFGALK